MVFVATRLSILALLVHEQVHFLGLRGQYGDLIVNLLAAYPLGITVEGYAKVHLAHHKYYFTENDPDFLRKSGIDWTFPMSARRLIKLVASDLFSLSFIKLLKGKRLDSPHIFKRPYSLPKWVRPTFYIGVLAILIYTEMWQVFLMYWFVTFIDNFSYVCTSLGIQ